MDKASPFITFNLSNTYLILPQELTQTELTYVLRFDTFCFEARIKAFMSLQVSLMVFGLAVHKCVLNIPHDTQASHIAKLPADMMITNGMSGSIPGWWRRSSLFFCWKTVFDERPHQRILENILSQLGNIIKAQCVNEGADKLLLKRPSFNT